MHILLTDILSCPQCGPEFGLILLADRIDERRVQAGALGCANCQRKYPIHEGLADLRVREPDTAKPVQADASPPGADTPTVDARDAFRWAAMMGVTEGPGFILMAGPAAAAASAVAGMIEGIEVVVAESEPYTEQAAGLSRIAIDTALPFYSGKLRAVTLSGGVARSLLAEGARAVGPLGRIVLDPAPPDAQERLQEHGLRVMARQGTTVVAGRF